MNDDRARRLTLAATVLGSSLAFVDASVVIVTLPTIERSLGFGLAGEQWVFLAYSLALAALYLPAGAVGDRLGRRETFAAGVVAFAAASALAGAAPNASVLIVARVLQGVAGAFVTTNRLALLRETYGGESGRAVGLWTSFTSLATIGWPPLGGAIVEWPPGGGSSSSICRLPPGACSSPGRAAARSASAITSAVSTSRARCSPRPRSAR